MPRSSQPKVNSRVIAEGQQYTICSDISAAIALVRMLSGTEAEDWSRSARAIVGRTITDFLCQYREYVENVEHGAKELLLQAAVQVGEKKRKR